MLKLFLDGYLAPHLGIEASTPIDKILEILGQSERIIEAMGKPDVFQTVLDAGSPIFREFERTALQPMYQRVAEAIREVDTRHWIFIEPSVSANTGFRSAIQPVKGKDGQPDPLQVFAPHAYDLVTDTPLGDQVSSDRVKLIISELRKHADQIGLPLYIGEWGGYPGSSGVGNAAREMIDLLHEAQAGQAYWAYHRDFDQAPYFKSLSRQTSEQDR
jgi:endoglycosylceramidase